MTDTHLARMTMKAWGDETKKPMWTYLERVARVHWNVRNDWDHMPETEAMRQAWDEDRQTEMRATLRTLRYSGLLTDQDVADITSTAHTRSPSDI